MRVHISLLILQQRYACIYMTIVEQTSQPVRDYESIQIQTNVHTHTHTRAHMQLINPEAMRVSQSVTQSVRISVTQCTGDDTTQLCLIINTNTNTTNNNNNTTRAQP